MRFKKDLFPALTALSLLVMIYSPERVSAGIFIAANGVLPLRENWEGIRLPALVFPELVTLRFSVSSVKDQLFRIIL